MPSVLGLPAEGVTLEWVARPIGAIFLTPVVSGILLLTSMKNPDNVTKILSNLSNRKIGLSTVNGTFKVLLAVGFLYRLNKFLSRKVLNNWVSDKTWSPSKEIVVVTGGSSGIGEIMVEKFVKAGFRVAVLDIVEPKSKNSTALFYKTDITSSKAIREAAEKIRADLGEPTVLINNAGVGSCEPILEESEQMILLTFDVNIVAHFLLIREFAPFMIKHNHGHIVTIASLASFIVHASNVDYAATKAAALAFHEGLAQELKSRYSAPTVRTSVVHPTWVRTPLIDKLSEIKGFNEFVLQPETVADAVVAQVLKGESAQLIIPGRYSYVPSIRGWFSWIQEGLRNGVADMLKVSPETT